MHYGPLWRHSESFWGRIYTAIQCICICMLNFYWINTSSWFQSFIIGATGRQALGLEVRQVACTHLHTGYLQVKSWTCFLVFCSSTTSQGVGSLPLVGDSWMALTASSFGFTQDRHQWRLGLTSGQEFIPSFSASFPSSLFMSFKSN